MSWAVPIFFQKVFQSRRETRPPSLPAPRSAQRRSAPAAGAGATRHGSCRGAELSAALRDAMAARVAVRIATAAAAEAGVECVTVSPGGERVYAGTSGGALLVYTLPAASAAAAAPGAAPQQLQLAARRALSRKPIEVRHVAHERTQRLLQSSADATLSPTHAIGAVLASGCAPLGSAVRRDRDAAGHRHDGGRGAARRPRRHAHSCGAIPLCRPHGFTADSL